MYCWEMATAVAYRSAPAKRSICAGVGVPALAGTVTKALPHEPLRMLFSVERSAPSTVRLHLYLTKTQFVTYRQCTLVTGGSQFAGSRSLLL
jgi:hypothetical protein